MEKVDLEKAKNYLDKFTTLSDEDKKVIIEATKDSWPEVVEYFFQSLWGGCSAQRSPQHDPRL